MPGLYTQGLVHRRHQMIGTNCASSSSQVSSSSMWVTAGEMEPSRRLRSGLSPTMPGTQTWLKERVGRYSFVGKTRRWRLDFLSTRGFKSRAEPPPNQGVRRVTHDGVQHSGAGRAMWWGTVRPHQFHCVCHSVKQHSTHGREETAPPCWGGLCSAP